MPSAFSAMSSDQSGDVTSGPASNTQTLTSMVNQEGLVNVAVTPNIQVGKAESTATGHRSDQQMTGLPGFGIPLGLPGQQ